MTESAKSQSECSDTKGIQQLKLSNNIKLDDSVFLDNYYEISDQANWALDFIDNNYIITNELEKFTLSVDLQSGNYAHRNNNPAKEPLLQAIKIKGKLPATVIDATPGVLKDGFLMASRGINVIAIERNPLIYILLKQAVSSIQSIDDLGNKNSNVNIRLVFGNSAEKIKDYINEKVDLIYIDPMYPPKKKSALVKKEMRILKSLVGVDFDSEQLFHKARELNTRLVVKRPNYANTLSNILPSFESKTGNTRFDVYLPNVVK